MSFSCYPQWLEVKAGLQFPETQPASALAVGWASALAVHKHGDMLAGPTQMQWQPSTLSSTLEAVTKS